MIHMVVGAQYAWGAMVPYVVGYYRMKGYDINLSQFYAVLPIKVMVSTLVFPLGMQGATMFGSRIVIFIGLFLAIVSTLVASTKNEPLSFLIVYALGFGVAKGLLYPAPIRAGHSHLPGRRGLVSGVIVSGLGFGSFLFGIIANEVCNPDNLPTSPVEIKPGVFENYFPDEVNERVPKMFVTFAQIYLFTGLVGVLLITNYKKHEDVDGNVEEPLL